MVAVMGMGSPDNRPSGLMAPTVTTAVGVCPQPAAMAGFFMPAADRWEKSSVSTYWWIALGSALGGVARYACSNLAAARYGLRFPWGTLVVNVVGSFVIGVFAASAGHGGWLGDPTVDLFVIVGLCGGYTTFSAFSLQTLELAHAEEWGRAAANVVLSVVLCLIAVVLGVLGARVL